MLEEIKIHVRLNISYEDAEYLYDEIRDNLSLCLERVREYQSPKLKDDVFHLQKILTPPSLTQYLSEKMNTDKISVKSVFVAPEIATFSSNLLVEIEVPNIWAMNYGKVTTEQLSDTIDFLVGLVETRSKPVDPPKLEHTTATNLILVNGKPVKNPITGSIFYDELSSEMKVWDGSKCSKWNINA